MENEKYYNILKQAEAVFRLPPDKKLHNDLGLCNFFKKLNLIQKDFDFSDIKKILGGDKYVKDSFTFCDGEDQDTVFQNQRHLYFERADWCKERMKKFE